MKSKVYKYPMQKGITSSPKFAEKGLAAFAINTGTKCNNDCLYCSTGSMLFRHPSFKNCNQDPFKFGYAIIDPDKPKKVAADARSKRKRGLIEMCTYTDAYCKAARRLGFGRKCLEAVLQEPEWIVRILTKNHEVEEDFDLIKQYRDRVIVGLSITATPDKAEITQIIEPYASTIKERMRVLKKAHQLGLRTFMMLCPLLPSIGDNTEQIDSYIRFAEEIGAEEIFAEAVNPRGKGLPLTQQALKNHGFFAEAQAIAEIIPREGWSQYCMDLIRNIQKSVRRYSDIRKLRFLLYPKNLLTEHVEQVKKDERGIIWL